MSRPILFVDAHLYAAHGPQQHSWLLVEAGRIAALGNDAPPAVPDAERIALGGAVLAPGLIDMHAHGALGRSTLEPTPDALTTIARFYAQHGVTGFLAATWTVAADDILAALDNIAGVMRVGTGGARLLGAHVEGPYIDVERRGAQRAEHVRRADRDEYRRWAATGTVKLLALAPEYPENTALIPQAVADGVVVAAGHTRATYEQMCMAVDLGLSQVTHMFNGMEPLHHRTPGVVGAGLTLDALRCEVIADNIHLHPVILKLVARAKGSDSIVLVTDAIRGVGLPDGEYEDGGNAIFVKDGIARIAAGNLAGSTLTLERGVANMIAATGWPLETVLPMATRVPARALGLEQRTGSIAVGKDADLVVLDERFNVQLTMVGGDIVYRTGQPSAE
jgi:N-acetylglucosamine-6-phosphate deacetylase